MKIIHPGASPDIDSVAYILSNVSMCFTLGSEHIMISYLRGSDVETTTIAIARVDEVHPGLAAALIDVTNNATPEAYTKFKAMVAVVLGSNVTLRPAGMSVHPYSDICNIAKASSSAMEGWFDIDAITFNIQGVNTYGLADVDVCPNEHLTLPSTFIDAIWPGASKIIPVMESVGYSQSEIVSHLLSGCNQGIGIIDVALPRTDLNP